MSLNSADAGFSRVKKVGVWSQDTQIHPKESLIPRKSLETEADIPSIPDIDDLPDIDPKESNTIPKINQTVKYQELDSELLKQNSFVALDNVNLSPLLKFIHPDVHIKEDDTVWTIDSLFSELSKYYQNENKDD